MKKKQVINLLAILCLSISFLSGCGEKEGKQTNTNDNLKTEVTQAPCDKTEASVTPVVTEAAVKATGWQVIKSFQYDFPVYSTAFYNSDFGITARMSGEIHYTSDQGIAWPQAENNTACLFGVDIIDENVAFVSGNSCNNAKTTDGGKTWTSVTDYVGANTDHCDMASFFDENTGIIANENKIGYTKDGGITWTDMTTPAKIKAIHLTNATKGYVIGMDRKLYVTNDTGATWEAQELNIDGFENNLDLSQSCAFSISEDGTGILFYLEKGGILKCFETKDDAVTWTKSDELNVSDAIDSPYVLYLSHDASTLTVQSLTGGNAAVVTYVE